MRYAQLLSTAILAVCIFIATPSATICAQSLDNEPTGSNDESSSASSQPNDSTSSQAEEKTGLGVTGYDLSNSHGAFPVSIEKGESINLSLYIYDESFSGTTADDVAVRLNTASFTIDVNRNPIEITIGSNNTYTIRFTNLVYTGKGSSFQCDIYYPEQPDIALYPYSIQLNQCVEYIAPEEPPEEEEEITIKGTGFVLKSVEYGENNITAGDEFMLDAVLMVTNGTYSVENLSLEITPSETFSLSEGSSIVYIGTVNPNAELPLSIPLIASAIAEEGSHKVTLALKGVSSNDGADVSASMDISIPVVQPERFEITNFNAPTSLVCNSDDGQGFTSFSLVNKGKTILYNVSVTAVGKGITSEPASYYIGNISSGTQSNADINILATQAGDIEVTVIVSYETARGEEKEITSSFWVTVEENRATGTVDAMGIVQRVPEEENTGIPLWLWAVSLCILVAGAVVFFTTRRRVMAKRLALEDDFADEEEDTIDEAG